MPLNKNALRRYLIIDRCIRNTMSPFPSRAFLVKKIIEELYLESFSLEMLDKDIRELKEQHNAPIKFSKGRSENGYYYDDPNYHYGTGITDDDLWILDFAAAAVEVYGHTRINEKFINLSDRLNTGSNDGRVLEDVPYNCIQIEGSTTKKGYEWLFDLYLYANQNQAVDIEYRAFGRDETKHTLSPYLLKQYRNRWYVVGLSHVKKLTIILALDRITKMTKTKESYLVDPDFSRYDYFKYGFGAFHSHENPAEKVQLLFSESLRPYILSLPIHPTQEIITDNKNGLLIEIEIYCKGNYDFIGKVLSYGNDVEVITPGYLKEIILNKAKAMMAKYT